MNTLENKVKFFGVYIGQMYYRDIVENGSIKTVGPYPMYNSFDNVLHSMDQWFKTAYPEVESVRDHLLLTLLSQITDEDVCEACKICGLIVGNTSEDYLGIEDYSSVEHLRVSWNAGFDELCYPSCLFDFLRSKGYALPWMGISVEQQVEYGWIKLKES